MVFTQHTPVMLNEVIEYLKPYSGGKYIDCTLGGGGHTEAILRASAPAGQVLGFDADAEALERVKERHASVLSEGRLKVVHANFGFLREKAEAESFQEVDGVLFDLGWSSDQIADQKRGFSFMADAPLDMRFDQTKGQSAADIVNSSPEEELADIFWRYGEEKRSRQIARKIVEFRKKDPLRTTKQLASLTESGVKGHPGGIHPATRIFQALRIATNGELEQLESALPQALSLLKVSGRLAVITFHSLEDRIVKNFIHLESQNCICPPRLPACVCGHKASIKIVSRKAISPSSLEIEANPRARSAKLRVAEKLLA